MEQLYKFVYQGGEGEIVEKKSRFIAIVYPISEEEEALGFIEKQRKKYWDARHQCFAYVIGERNQIQRCSDDGEPSGTAGKPILDILLGEEIHNAIIVVVRYFGGTLLGTGGLVRAYSQSAKEALENSIVAEKIVGKKYRIETDYNGIGKLQYITGQMDLYMLDTEYTDVVNSYIVAPLWKAEAFEKKVIEASAGKADIEILDKVYYAVVEGKLQIYD